MFQLKSPQPQTLPLAWTKYKALHTCQCPKNQRKAKNSPLQPVTHPTFPLTLCCTSDHLDNLPLRILHLERPLLLMRSPLQPQLLLHLLLDLLGVRLVHDELSVYYNGRGRDGRSRLDASRGQVARPAPSYNLYISLLNPASE